MLTKIAVSCDEYGHLVDALLALLRKRGYEPIYFGPHAGEEAHDWPLVTQQAIDQVLKGKTTEAIVMCWTGTGCTIVANKSQAFGRHCVWMQKQPREPGYGIMQMHWHSASVSLVLRYWRRSWMHGSIRHAVQTNGM